jgi:hypothetical protein
MPLIPLDPTSMWVSSERPRCLRTISELPRRGNDGDLNSDNHVCTNNRYTTNNIIMA